MSINDKYLMLLAPVADAFAGNKTFPIVNMMHYGKATFIVQAGVNASTGRVNFQVDAVDGTGPAYVGNSRAVAAKYRTTTNSTLGDTAAAVSYNSTISGTTVSPASFAATTLLIEVDEQDVAKAASAGGFAAVGIQLKTQEVFDAAIVGAVVCELSEPKYGLATMKSGYFCSGIAYDIRTN